MENKSDKIVFENGASIKLVGSEEGCKGIQPQIQLRYGGFTLQKVPRGYDNNPKRWKIVAEKCEHLSQDIFLGRFDLQEGKDAIDLFWKQRRVH